MAKKKLPAVRRNIVQPVDWWVAFNDAAEKEGLTVSQWMGRVCKKALPKDVREKLEERVPAHRPKKKKKGKK